MEESPRQADIQAVYLLRGIPKVHSRVHKNPLLVPVMSQINPIHVLLSYYFNVHFITILFRLCQALQALFPL